MCCVYVAVLPWFFRKVLRDRPGEASVWKDWGSTHYQLGCDRISEYHWGEALTDGASWEAGGGPGILYSPPPWIVVEQTLRLESMGFDRK